MVCPESGTSVLLGSSPSSAVINYLQDRQLLDRGGQRTSLPGIHLCHLE